MCELKVFLHVASRISFTHLFSVFVLTMNRIDSMCRSFYEKLRAGQEDELDGIELAEEAENGDPKALSMIQLARVLKPYFWPK